MASNQSARKASFRTRLKSTLKCKTVAQPFHRADRLQRPLLSNVERQKHPRMTFTHRLRLRQRLRLNGQPSAPVSPTKTDVFLSRAANASQLGLLALAVFGYFYTVLPVYQKSLLDEEIAKKSIELNRKEAELSKRDDEIATQAATLEKLNAAVSSAQQRLTKSQIEIGQLRGAVQTQYSELQPRLVYEFQLLSSKLCKLSQVPDGGFSACVREKVLPTVNLAALTQSDRALLGQLVDAENDAIHASWKDFVSTISKRRQEAQEQKTKLAGECERMKASADYGDRMKKISIDYQCRRDDSNTQFALSKIQIDELFTGERFISSAMENIKKRFYAKTSSR